MPKYALLFIKDKKQYIFLFICIQESKRIQEKYELSVKSGIEAHTRTLVVLGIWGSLRGRVLR